ncbi:MAG TPA: TonB-dependent receptor [Steroidobacteraceae bacterium]|nr:TonB-dependent receptor [Steroidobacteraceae bacterium]
MNTKVSCAVAAILGSVSLGALAAPPDNTDSGASAASSDVVGEITVTAQRRTESMQNVPISMQALTSQTLEQLNISTFDDYIKYLPNVTTANNGPGQSEIFMRGLSAGSQASQGSGSTGLWPNVAIYIDNQSGQLPNRNLDIYAADLNRIEVLEGPQGTLFGAGAEAGVIRYITNEPKLNVTEGSLKAGYGTTAHGDPNADATAVVNLPIITDHMAVRAVIYDDHRGGYIDNVPATFTRKDTDIGIHYANYPAVNGVCPDGGVNNGYCVPPGSPSLNNYNIAASAINPVEYQGIRVELLYKFNDDWNVLLSQMYQDMNSQGVFYDQPNASDGAPLAPLEVTMFNNAYDKDRFESTALTINGRLGPISAVYSGGYLVRNVDQIGDYTNYARGVYADYYQCYGPGTAYDTTLKSTCFSPSAVWHSQEQNYHQQHELRFSTPDEWRLRGIVGAYYEANRLYDQTDWMYKTIPACTSNGPVDSPGNDGCLSNIGTVPDTTVQYPGELNSSSSFYQDTMRETQQTAFFVSMDFDILPKVLTVTLGTRHFVFNNSSVGSVTSSFYCFEQGNPPGGCHLDAYDLNAQNLRDTESGFKSRGNLTWHITPDVMAYYTFSQGFRPGGFNQNGGTEHAYGPDGVDQYVLPKSYLSDKLTNNEIGWKAEFLDHRLQWNGAIYRENWDNVQIAFFDPGLVGNIFYNTNGQNFLIKGVETSLVARPLSGLTLQYAASWNQSRQTNSPALIDNNPASVNYGKPITEDCDSAGSACTPVTNPFGPIGSASANAPPIQLSVRARYQWSVGAYTPFVQLGATHQGISFTQAGANPTIDQSGGLVSTSRLRFENPAYSVYDASVGVAKDAWYANVFGENLANSHASTFVSTDQFIVAQTPLRPRVIGLTFGYNF